MDDGHRSSRVAVMHLAIIAAHGSVANLVGSCSMWLLLPACVGCVMDNTIVFSVIFMMFSYPLINSGKKTNEKSSELHDL